MKRLLLLIVLIWSLTGCGDAQEEASSDDSPETTEKATLEETSEKTSGETTEEVTEETVVVEEPIAAEEPVVVEAPPEAPSVPDPSPPQSAVSGTAEDCIPSCQGAAIRRGEVPLTAQEEANLRAQGILDPGSRRRKRRRPNPPTRTVPTIGHRAGRASVNAPTPRGEITRRYKPKRCANAGYSLSSANASLSHQRS